MKKLKALPGRNNPCLCCPPIPAQASMDKIIAVGFGDARLTCDGETVLEGERTKDGKERKRFVTFKEAEKMAAKDPKKDWRVVLYGPLHGEVYQRQGKEKWVLVEKNEGFA